jgi:hypothetical protein
MDSNSISRYVKWLCNRQTTLQDSLARKFVVMSRVEKIFPKRDGVPMSDILETIHRLVKSDPKSYLLELKFETEEIRILKDEYQRFQKWLAKVGGSIQIS